MHGKFVNTIDNARDIYDIVICVTITNVLFYYCIVIPWDSFTLPGGVTYTMSPCNNGKSVDSNQTPRSLAADFVCHGLTYEYVAIIYQSFVEKIYFLSE